MEIGAQGVGGKRERESYISEAARISQLTKGRKAHFWPGHSQMRQVRIAGQAWRWPLQGGGRQDARCLKSAGFRDGGDGGVQKPREFGWRIGVLRHLMRFRQDDRGLALHAYPDS
jgi:hypothetical protein